MSSPTKKTAAKQLKVSNITRQKEAKAMATAPRAQRFSNGRCLNSADTGEQFIGSFMGHVSFECTLLYVRPNTQELLAALKTQRRHLRKWHNLVSGLPTSSLSAQDSNTCEKHYDNCDEENLG
jgi:hypothetical protein